ncbi:Hypothetical Protein RSKD131_2181 [Cereibacter sphaeroides KD131]|nr:Hypothetical Protein RSKD131_2181 [Cereibacter sphaeroides KD131]
MWPHIYGPAPVGLQDGPDSTLCANWRGYRPAAARRNPLASRRSRAVRGPACRARCSRREGRRACSCARTDPGPARPCSGSPSRR